jgi:hypothetical protein
MNLTEGKEESESDKSAKGKDQSSKGTYVVLQCLQQC